MTKIKMDLSATDFSLTFTLCIFECVMKNNILKHIGDDDIGGTPVPIQTTAVKPYDAEDT